MRSSYSYTIEAERNSLIRQLVARQDIDDGDENFEIAEEFCRQHLAPHNNRFREPSQKVCERTVVGLLDRLKIRSELRAAEALRSLFESFQRIVEAEVCAVCVLCMYVCVCVYVCVYCV